MLNMEMMKAYQGMPSGTPSPIIIIIRYQAPQARPITPEENKADRRSCKRVTEKRIQEVSSTKAIPTRKKKLVSRSGHQFLLIMPGQASKAKATAHSTPR